MGEKNCHQYFGKFLNLDMGRLSSLIEQWTQKNYNLFYRFLELEGGLHSLEGAAPLHGRRLSDILNNRLNKD